jgi:ABC-type protease/lipase transport system fused ATPase/permease subunit
VLAFAEAVAVTILIAVLVGLLCIGSVVVIVIVAILGKSRTAEHDGCAKRQAKAKNTLCDKSFHDILLRVAGVKTRLEAFCLAGEFGKTLYSA